MRVTIIVTIPSWLKLPVLGEYEDGHYEGRGVQHHREHNGHDDVDRKPFEFQILPDIQDVVGYFRAARYSKYVYLNTLHGVFLASPIVSHEKQLGSHNHIVLAGYEHNHKVPLLTEYLGLAWVHQELKYLADEAVHEPIVLFGVPHLTVVVL